MYQARGGAGTLCMAILNVISCGILCIYMVGFEAGLRPEAVYGSTAHGSVASARRGR